MRSWVFRNRIALERVYGSPARLRPLTELDEEATLAPGTASASEAKGQAPMAGETAPQARRLVLYHLSPLPRESQRKTG